MTIETELLPKDRREALSQMMASQPFRDLLLSLRLKAVVLQHQATDRDPDLLLTSAALPQPTAEPVLQAARLLSAVKLLQSEAEPEVPQYIKATLRP